MLKEVLRAMGVPDDKFAATCVLVDKLEKVPIDAIRRLATPRPPLPPFPSVLTGHASYLSPY